LDSIGDGVIRTDAHGRVDYLNPVAERLTGWTSGEARGRPSKDVFNVVQRVSQAAVCSLVEDCLRLNCTVTPAQDILLISQDGCEYRIENSATPIRNSGGAAVGVVLVFYDVSEQRQLHEELRYRATHDGMTGLVNRYEFENHLAGSLVRPPSETQQCALLFIDLDGFKLVNDAAGHAAGDQLLKHIASMLKVMADKDDIAARLGETSSR
jgi:diguanylate cyclase